MDSDDRRQHPRRPFEAEVLCYIDGNRLDSRTADISTGGLFLRTPRFENFPAGAIVALVFEDLGVPPGTAFLFARVMRHQAGPNPGVGLHWERAVCAGSPLPLQRVVNRLFGFADVPVTSRELPERGMTQFIFRFPTATDPAAAPAEPVRADPAPAQPAPAPAAPRAPSAYRVSEVPAALELDRPEPAARGRTSMAIPRDPVPPVPPEPPAPKPPAAPPEAAGGRKGPLTSQIDTRGTRQIVDMPAFLEAGGVPIPVRMRWIGMGAAGVDCPWVPADPEMPLLLRFEIPTREGPVELKCNSRLRSSDLGKGGRTPALELAVKDVDEAGHAGLLVRYLKWLAFRQLAKE
jgi:hypothetical protein